MWLTQSPLCCCNNTNFHIQYALAHSLNFTAFMDVLIFYKDFVSPCTSTNPSCISLHFRLTKSSCTLSYFSSQFPRALLLSSVLRLNLANKVLFNYFLCVCVYVCRFVYASTSFYMHCVCHVCMSRCTFTNIHPPPPPLLWFHSPESVSLLLLWC